MDKDKLLEKNHNCDNVNCNHYNTNGLCCLFNPDNCKYRQLQKENAELKDYRLTTLAKQQTEMSEYALNLEHKLSWYDNQLTKAKEMIKELYEGLDRLYLSGLSAKQIAFIEKLQDKAEQFLNENEVEG